MLMFIFLWLRVQGEINQDCDPYSLNEAFLCQLGFIKKSKLDYYFFNYKILRMNPEKSEHDQDLADCLRVCEIDDNQCLRSCYLEHDEKEGSSKLCYSRENENKPAVRLKI